MKAKLILMLTFSLLLGCSQKENSIAEDSSAPEKKLFLDVHDIGPAIHLP
ncbi:MAG: hypothetical protein WEB30_13280 [Cyclobacteriaceae bacterium]